MHQGARQPFCSYLYSVNRRILAIDDIVVKIEYCQPLSTAFKEIDKYYCFICSCHVPTKEKFSHGPDRHRAHHALCYIEKEKGGGRNLSLYRYYFIYRYNLYSVHK